MAKASRLNSRRSSTCPAPSIAHTENTLFAKSTPRVIVLMETSSSADGCVATPSWPSRPQGEEVSFYSSKRKKRHLVRRTVHRGAGAEIPGVDPTVREVESAAQGGRHAGFASNHRSRVRSLA